MTRNFHRKNDRIVGIAPSGWGFGFAVLEDKGQLIDWGTKGVKKDKNAGSLRKADLLLAYYKPKMLVLPNASARGSRRSPRIKKLIRRLVELGKRHNVDVRLFSIEEMKDAFFADGEGTKYTIAQILAYRFTEELGRCLPPKRKPWVSEDCRMDIFEAVALALLPSIRSGIGSHKK